MTKGCAAAHPRKAWSICKPVCFTTSSTVRFTPSAVPLPVPVRLRKVSIWETSVLRPIIRCGHGISGSGPLARSTITTMMSGQACGSIPSMSVTMM